MDLFDFLDSRVTCSHVFGVGKDGTAWTREHDPKSPNFARWVHSDPNCRRPAHFEEPTP